VFARVTRLDLRENSGDFRLIDRRALDVVLSMRERNRFLRGMTVWVGFTQTAVPYERDGRQAGSTKYTPRRMLRFALDAISSFSSLPLQAATLLGFFFSALAFLMLPLVVVARYAGIYTRGVPSVLFVVLLLGGIQLITVGIIGEYVGRIYDEVKRRPLYVVSGTKNLEPPSAPPPEAPERESISAP
jgi:dolichol-phosphate mannosyltransferase